MRTFVLEREAPILILYNGMLCRSGGMSRIGDIIDTEHVDIFQVSGGEARQEVVFLLGTVEIADGREMPLYVPASQTGIRREHLFH